jgi:hypothetical protein
LLITAFNSGDGIMKTAFGIIGGAMLMLASPAMAQTYTFNTIGNDADNGSYGNAKQFNSVQSNNVKLQVTGWQSKQSSNAITSAYVGAYSGGLGVTGLGDQGGDYNLHQIDNNNGYTDFVLLQFSQAVTLSSIATNVYGIYNSSDGTPGWFVSSVSDDDWAWYDAGSISTPAWNTRVDMSAYSTVPSTWTQRDSSVNTTGATTASTKWLVGAAFTPTSDRDDGFKIASITVNATPTTPAVPEPATWAMMLIGFGTLGSAMRRSRRRQALAIA